MIAITTSKGLRLPGRIAGDDYGVMGGIVDDDRVVGDINVNIRPVIPDVADKLKLDVGQIPETYPLPVSDAAFLCGISVASLEDLIVIFEQTKKLKNEHLKDFPSVPTYWADNISEYILFYRQIEPSILLKSSLNFDILMDFILSVVSNKEWILNPHLKATYTRLLSSLVPLENEDRRKSRDENFSFVFKQNPFYEQNLIEGLVTIFVEVEKTSFYEKFSFRYEICHIINYLHKTTFAFEKFIIQSGRVTIENPRGAETVYG